MDQPAAPPRANWPVALVVTLFALSALVMVMKGSDDSPTRSADTEPVALKRLPLSSTHTRIDAAPKDQRPDATPKGTVVHPRRTTAVYDAPAGKPFAKVASQNFGDTWLPVITRNRDWVQVMLPSKPNGSTGWIDATDLQEATSHHLIKVNLSMRRLELFDDGTSVGVWTVAVGAPSTPTPTGRTFLLGQLVDDQQSFSPVILPLGAHSDTLDTYGGGPGTVAIHGWTDPSVFGKAVSHGCIRVPDDALELLRTVPLGTPVMVTE